MEMLIDIISTSKEEILNNPKPAKLTLHSNHLQYVIQFNAKALEGHDDYVEGEEFYTYSNICIRKSDISSTQLNNQPKSGAWSVTIGEKLSFSLFYKDYEKAKEAKKVIDQWLFNAE